MAAPIPLHLLPAILSSSLLLLLLPPPECTALIPPIDAQPPSTSHEDHHFLCQLQEAKLKIARLESVLKESIQELTDKSLHLKELEKLIEDMTHEIDHLQSALPSLKEEASRADERLDILEEEVRLLWAVSRKNNFELHILESESEDAEKRLEFVTSKVKQMADIVTEQWIQIQQLEQAVQIAERRTLKVKRQVSFTRCTFLKFIKSLFGDNLEKLTGMLYPYLPKEGPALRSYVSQILHQLEQILAAVRHYHHQLQGFIKREMERNEFTAALANKEVVFFVASTLITFPLIGAWMLISSQFG